MMKRSLASFLVLLVVALVAIAQTPSAPANLVIFTNQGGGASSGGGEDPPAEGSSECEGQSNLHYVRAAGGSYGSEDGTDWNNAYDGLPATLQRGHSYYLGNGDFGSGYTFNDAASSNQLIRVCKATAADHGTDTGWDDAYAAPATWTGQFVVTTDDWVIDGAYRDEDDWFDNTAYGFQINTPNTAGCTGSNTCFDQQFVIDSSSSQRDSITLKYTYLRGRNALPSCCNGNADRIYAIDTDPFDGSVFHTNLVFSHLYISGSNNVFFIRGTNGTIIEYSASLGALGDSDNHGEIVNLYFTAENAIVRFNDFREAYTLDGGQGTAIIAIQDTNGHDIYGNSFCDFKTGDGSIGFIGGNASNMVIYNNTIANGTGDGMGIQGDNGSGNAARNNLLIGGTATKGISLGSGQTVTHNGYSTASGSGTSTQLNIATSIFVDYANCDLRLASATDAGVTLASPYDTDLLGITRGADGTWDRGAYDHVAP